MNSTVYRPVCHGAMFALVTPKKTIVCSSPAASDTVSMPPARHASRRLLTCFQPHAPIPAAASVPTQTPRMTHPFHDSAPHGLFEYWTVNSWLAKRRDITQAVCARRSNTHMPKMPPCIVQETTLAPGHLAHPELTDQRQVISSSVNFVTPSGRWVTRTQTDFTSPFYATQAHMKSDRVGRS
jgi:hypothetical protein